MTEERRFRPFTKPLSNRWGRPLTDPHDRLPGELLRWRADVRTGPLNIEPNVNRGDAMPSSDSAVKPL